MTAGLRDTRTRRVRREANTIRVTINWRSRRQWWCARGESCSPRKLRYVFGDRRSLRLEARPPLRSGPRDYLSTVRAAAACEILGSERREGRRRCGRRVASPLVAPLADPPGDITDITFPHPLAAELTPRSPRSRSAHAPRGTSAPRLERGTAHGHSRSHSSAELATTSRCYSVLLVRRLPRLALARTKAGLPYRGS